MKVELEDLRLGLSALTQEAQVGILDKANSALWKHKKEIQNDFLYAVVQCWEGKTQTISNSKGTWEIQVKKVTAKSKTKV